MAHPMWKPWHQVVQLRDDLKTGELALALQKAQAIEAERAGLKQREIEQAVCAVFLHSQPIGKKALTPELMVLLGATRPDEIELEKGLRRWADTSWFLDELEANTAEVRPDGTKGLPKAWRLGNRPNLTQMHDDACKTRIPPELIEIKLLDEIEKLKSLTQGATAAGARVHLFTGKAERRRGRRGIPRSPRAEGRIGFR